MQQWLVGQIPKLYVVNMESPTLVIFRYDCGWMHGHVPESLHYGYENYNVTLLSVYQSVLQMYKAIRPVNQTYKSYCID